MASMAPTQRSAAGGSTKPPLGNLLVKRDELLQKRWRLNRWWLKLCWPAVGHDILLIDFALQRITKALNYYEFTWGDID